MSTLPYERLSWPIVWPAVELIAAAEGCRLEAYLCPAGVWTCGWGETAGVRQGDVWSQDEADARLLSTLRALTIRVRGQCTVPPMPNELGALVSLAYNIGVDALAGSTVLRRHNAGDHEEPRPFETLRLGKPRLLPPTSSVSCGGSPQSPRS